MLFSAVYIEFYPRRSLRSNVRTFQSKLHRSSGAKIPPAPICPVRIGTSWGLWTLALNPLSATLMNLPRKCCKQKTYSLSKAFRCNTYKKHGGGAFFPFRNYPSLTNPANTGRSSFSRDAGHGSPNTPAFAAPTFASPSRSARIRVETP